MKREALSAISVLAQAHAVGVAVDLIDEHLWVQEIDPTTGRGGLSLAEPRILHHIRFVGEDIFVVIERIDEHAHEVVHGDLVHLLNAGNILRQVIVVALETGVGDDAAITTGVG